MYVVANLCRCKLEVCQRKAKGCTIRKYGSTTQVCARTYVHVVISKASMMNNGIN